LMMRDIYDNFNSRPHLTINDTGDIVVRGGVRRPKPGELPPANPPETTSVPPVK